MFLLTLIIKDAKPIIAAEMSNTFIHDAHPDTYQPCKAWKQAACIQWSHASASCTACCTGSRAQHRWCSEPTTSGKRRSWSRVPSRLCLHLWRRGGWCKGASAQITPLLFRTSYRFDWEYLKLIQEPLTIIREEHSSKMQLIISQIYLFYYFTKSCRTGT